MSEVETHDDAAPARKWQQHQQQQPFAVPHTGRGADSAMAAMKRKRIPQPGEPPAELEHEGKPTGG